MARYSLQTAPAAEPVSLAEVKMQLGYAVSTVTAAAFTAKDDEFTRYIKTARMFVENYLSRAIITQTWDMYLDSWPLCREFEIGKGNIQSVSVFEYTDTEGTTANFTDYTLDTVSIPGRVVLNYREEWPSVELSPVNPIHLRFDAGFGAAGSDVPEPIRTAIFLLIAHMDRQKEPVVVRNTVATVQLLPFAIDDYLADYRVVRF